MFGPITIPYESVMLLNICKLKNGSRFEEAEMAIGEVCTLTKNNHQNNFHKILAPMIGTFFLTPEPGAEAFVKVGDEVSQGDTLCIIEAMKMMNQIESDVNGIVERILVQSGDPIEYGQTLFLISQN